MFDDDDIIEGIIQKRGPVLNAYKRELDDLYKTLETVTNSVTEKEREVEVQTAEHRNLEEQTSQSIKNKEESKASKESVAEATRAIDQKRKLLNMSEGGFRNRISDLNAEFDVLKKAIAVGADWTIEQTEQREALEKERDAIGRQLESQMAQVSGLRNDVDRVYNVIQDFDREFTGFDERSADIIKKTANFEMEIAELNKRKDRLDKRIFELQTQVVQSENTIIERNRVLKSEDKTLADLDSHLTAAKEKMESYVEEYDGLLRTLQEVTGELDHTRVLNRKAEEESREKEALIAEKSEDIRVFTKETTKLTQLKEVCRRKIEEIEREKVETESRRDELNKQIDYTREVEIKQARKEVESLHKQITGLNQELEVLRKKEVSSDSATKLINDLIIVNKNAKRNLVVEKKIIEDEVKMQVEQIQALLTEKEKLEHDAEFTNQQFYTALEELKLQELQVKELQKKVVEDQSKLKHKQNLYETVRSDRNLYSKQLVESQEEITALKRTFRSMNHHIDQLQEEIASKDHVIVKEHFLHHSVDKERELLKNEITKIKKQVQSSEQIIENQQVEILKLSRIIEEADEERQRQKNELTSVLAERNLLTSQVVKRNVELNSMYDKIKIQRSNLRIGEIQHNKALEAIGKWQKELITIVQDHHGTVTALKGVEDLRKTIVALDKELRREQTKTRALDDELQRPMNVHRWRVLESSDPKRYEKICQIQALQLQLIGKSDEVVQNELLIQEKEKIYIELKNIISRQPGPEVEEQILVYQQTFKEKGAQLKAMDEELDMYRQQVGLFKDEIVRLDATMAAVKKKWFKVKKAQESAGTAA